VGKLPQKARRPARITKAAPEQSRLLQCLACDGVLTFVHSIVGGVGQWDRYICRGCASVFEYRRRTRTLTPSS
jgi:hypothetical protein